MLKNMSILKKNMRSDSSNISKQFQFIAQTVAVFPGDVEEHVEVERKQDVYPGRKNLNVSNFNAFGCGRS